MPKQGYLTASKFKQIMVPADIKDDKFGKGAVTLAREIARGMIGVHEDDSFVSFDMQRGIDLEPTAIFLYEQRHMVEVTNKQEWAADAILPYLGCHPDGKAGNIAIEVKCPNNKNHHDNLDFNQQYHDDYLDQCQGVAMILGCTKIHFISYNETFPEPLDLHVYEVEADTEWQALFRKRAELFWNELVLPAHTSLIEKLS